MGEISVLGPTGDTKTIWDKNNPDEVEIARTTFESFLKKGYAAFQAEGADGHKGKQIKVFDANAERIIFVPPMRGG